MFDFRLTREPRRGRAWVASLAVQGLLVAIFVGALQRVVVVRGVTADPTPDTSFVFLTGPREVPAPPRLGARDPQTSLVTAPVPVATADTAGSAAPTGPGFIGRIGPGPALGDGSLWVTPRPALPAAVADQLYGEAPATPRDSVAMGRLRAMVDSLNVMLDEAQRAQRLPDWTLGGDDGGPKWGIDPTWIHLGDIKIPTAALALLGNLLPQGSYDQALRQRQLAEMRRDLLYAAWRAQTFQDFRRYVNETRERRAREREEERRHVAGDTTGIVP